MTKETVAAFGISGYMEQEGGLTLHHYSTTGPVWIVYECIAFPDGR